MYGRLAHGMDDSSDEASDSDSGCWICALPWQLLTHPIVQYSDKETDPESKDDNLSGRAAWMSSEVEKLPQGYIPFRLQESSSVIESPISSPHQHLWKPPKLRVKVDQSVDRRNSINSHRLYKFKCSHCHKNHTGVRYIMIKEYRGMLKIDMRWK